jgi:hypothetical protein
MKLSKRLPMCAAAIMLAASAPLFVTPAPAWAQEKVPVTSLDDLPRHTYQIPGKASELLTDDAQFAALAKQIRADVEEVLATYDIRDATTLKGYYGVLLSLDMLEGRYDEALELVEMLRDLQEKEAARLTTGLFTMSYIEAKRQAGDDDDRFRMLFQKDLYRRFDALPWPVIQDEVEGRLGQVQMFSEPLIMGMIQAQLDPVVAQAGEVSGDLARSLVSMRSALQTQIPMKNELTAVYRKLVDDNRVEKQDIWAARNVTLPTVGDYTPVVVAIWDSGVDTDLFPGQLWTNDAEMYDGTDTDDNGYVDDVHGIATDLDSNRVPELLASLDRLTVDADDMMKYMKGFMDLQSAIDSEEATNVLKRMQTMKPEEVKSFIENMGIMGSYTHGTHVAGIAAAGNPHIRILTTRITFDDRMIPEAPTFGSTHREAAVAYDTIDYYKAHGVRVVNMSWGGNRAGIEAALEANGVGETAEERAELARKLFRISRDALYESMASAPEILFVTSAGNSDNDVEFDEMIPSGFDLPNLLVVGAVDQAGEPTDFTSFGRTVSVYANGFEVDSYVPGGETMAFSGTSMSSPNVVNLAAKMLAVDSTLTPTEVIELIEAGADEAGDEQPMLLINPRKTLQLVRRR